MATVITEPLRAEHRTLVPKLDGLRLLGTHLDEWEPAQISRSLAETVSVLRRDLLPHAQAEEAVLYPTVERTMAAPGAMATMVADHREIARRVEALAARGADLERGMPRRDQLEDLRVQVLGLWAIILLHLEKEEDVLLPVLDEHLSADEAHALFGALREHEQQAQVGSGREEPRA